MTPRQLTLSALLVCALLLPLTALADTESGTLETREAGRKIYNFRCYFCHGYSGDARTLAASYMPSKPRNFVASDPREFPMERLEESIANGRPGTAMPGFATLLTPLEIRQVAWFVRDEFMVRHAPNTRYHTPANGWPDHGRYQAA
ncbi:MAG: cytochrome c, partial [Magnetococcales bacterium]|nr:cytochrome c [Magnetococcales bacterium]